MSIEIRITGITPLETLSTLSAFGLYTMADSRVADTAQRIVAAGMQGPTSAPIAPPPSPALQPTDAFQPIAPPPSTAPPVQGSASGTAQTSLFPPDPRRVPPTTAPVAMRPPVVPPAQRGAVPVGTTAGSPDPHPPSAPPVRTPPLSTAPGFTLAQVCKAGADLVTQDPTKLPTLNGLLQKYGVQTLQDLSPEQLGPIAMELRSMGAVL